ncbi:MAG: hypothetical protein ACFE0Q_06435 [Anaerolineae bacterium]
MVEQYLVRTIILQNYFAPSAEVAELRRSDGAMDALVSAMKRTELAGTALEKELNAFAQRGLQITSIIPHPPDSTYPHDLIMTVILAETT